MLKEIIVSKVGSKALLYTTDGASASLLRCGFVPGAYATVDFGTSVNVTNNFQSMRLYQPRVSSDIYLQNLESREHLIALKKKKKTRRVPW